MYATVIITIFCKFNLQDIAHFVKQFVKIKFNLVDKSLKYHCHFELLLLFIHCIDYFLETC